MRPDRAAKIIGAMMEMGSSMLWSVELAKQLGETNLPQLRAELDGLWARGLVSCSLTGAYGVTARGKDLVARTSKQTA